MQTTCHDIFNRAADQTATSSILTKTLGQLGLLVDKNLGGDHVSESIESLKQVVVCELLGQVVYEKVGSLRAFVLFQTALG